MNGCGGRGYQCEKKIRVRWTALSHVCACVCVFQLLAGAPFGTTRSKTIPKEQLPSAQDLDTIWSLGASFVFLFVFF